MIQDIMPGTEGNLMEGMKVGYIGFDPTAPSLTVGNLVALMLLKHFQDCGHKPIVVMGGATGMIGDPSGKAEERKLLSPGVIQENLEHQKEQFLKFLNFEEKENSAEIVNNYDWFKNTSLLDFLRDVGKHLTVSYMLAKDSVKSRLEGGLSFTEFSYQLLQGYDFYHLYENKKCTLQMGGSDQWGNITAGTELIRRMGGGEAFALTTPLLTKADGTKFGKSEKGNIWLDPKLTSPYQFYQFWINTPDLEASKYLRYFTTLNQESIVALEKEHLETPHQRILQKALAEELTIRVHSKNDLDRAIKASELLFGNSSGEESIQFLKNLTELELADYFLDVFEAENDKGQDDVGPSFMNTNNLPISILDLVLKYEIFPSKSEARKMILGGGISINKVKQTDENKKMDKEDFLHGSYLLLQKGKKNYFLLKWK